MEKRVCTIQLTLLGKVTRTILSKIFSAHIYLATFLYTHLYDLVGNETLSKISPLDIQIKLLVKKGSKCIYISTHFVCSSTLETSQPNIPQI